ncbi:Intradiol ring-cleavage dioxygenase [Aspergillus filifer]
MLAERNVYPTIQNTTCVLAPETIWGPYGIDGELHRHDVRENQKGIDLYLDIGVIDVETCEPLPDAYLTIWSCNATGTYSSYTGIDPDTAELLDGWTKNDEGTTDNETFLRGITKTDAEGISEFLTIFPGYYTSRTTHIHVTVQTNVTDDETSYSTAAVQHIGQLFFDEDLLNTVYQEEPYVQHLATLNRTTNAEDSVLSTSSIGGYSPIISTALLGETIAEGLVGYITIGVNRSAEARETTGTDVNPQGFIPTVTPSAGAQEAAYALDRAEGYVDK